MEQPVDSARAYVIKANELGAIHYLDPDHRRPLLLEWINRGTDQKLQPTTIDMLMRTLFQEEVSPSVGKLHDAAGLRLVFDSERERNRFASEFAGALAQDRFTRQFYLTAIFESREHADRAVAELRGAGIPEAAISMIWHTDQAPETDFIRPEGHSVFSVAAAATGGGIAGTLLGVAVLAVPGVGSVMAAGAIISSFATVSGVIGATGGAIARMLSDPDVEGRGSNYFERQIQRGRVFVAIDTSIVDVQRERARDVLIGCAGQTQVRG